MTLRVMIRGGGDLGSGVALRLLRSGAQVIVIELKKPLVVRRAASYANAVYEGSCKVEETRGCLIQDISEADKVISRNEVPVLIDPEATSRYDFKPHVIIDARMAKKEPELTKESALLVVGLGPGFVSGVHCHAIIETKRGHTLGRVYWTGTAEADTQTPDTISGFDVQRVLKSPGTGPFAGLVKIGDLVFVGQKLAEVSGKFILAEIDGVIRGMIANDIEVTEGMKVGDLDPRLDPRLCYIVSDKALAIGGGVLEAIMSRNDLREIFCSSKLSA